LGDAQAIRSESKGQKHRGGTRSPDSCLFGGCLSLFLKPEATLQTNLVERTEGNNTQAHAPVRLRLWLIGDAGARLDIPSMQLAARRAPVGWRSRDIKPGG
jgi:hypothetical protein